MASTLFRTRQARLASRAAFALKGAADHLTSWNQARRTRNTLSRLSAHELEDIGLTPGDIDQITGRKF